ncbi:IMPACT family member YigZ [subsurface metagenome]
MGRSYTLPEPTPQVEHRVRGSRFIARTLPAASREEVREILRQARELMPDATHVCYVYRLMQQGDEPGSTGVTPDRLEEFATDAGEPGGSAGRPMLNVLRQAGLVDVVSWVGRYFGGTKLGIPGLMAAYAQAMRMSLEGITPVPWVAMVDVHVVLPYTLVDRVKSELQRVEGVILAEEYSQQVVLGLKVPRHAARGFVSRLREWGRGNIQTSSSAIDFGTEHA